MRTVLPLALCVWVGMQVALPALGQSAPPGQSEERFDARITMTADGATAMGPGFVLASSQPGQSASFTVHLTEAYTTVQVLASGLDLERPRQLVPHLRLDPTEPPCGGTTQCDFTLFHPFPDERVWDVDGPARVFFVQGSAQTVDLRLGIPGPVNATLVLERDVRAPALRLGPVTNVTHFSFYQETTTDELAVVDLQVRRVGTDEWVQNPTQVFHVLQRFPVQGLSPATEYEARAVAHDWAGNENRSSDYRVASAPLPQVPVPVVNALEPAPNATVDAGSARIRAGWSSPESAVADDGVRLFFDKRPVVDGVKVGPQTMDYQTERLAPGLHSVSVEVTNLAGGMGVARWTFDVRGAEVPGFAAGMSVAALALAATMLRRGTRDGRA